MELLLLKNSLIFYQGYITMKRGLKMTRGLKMKRIITLTLVICILASNQVSAMGIGIMPISENTGETTQLYINHEKIIFSDYSCEPYEKQGTMMLPLRSIAENLGFDVSWNNEEKSIEITKGTIYTKIYIGQDDYFYGKVASFPLGIAPEIEKSRTFVPSTFFEKILFTDVVIEGKVININGYVDYEFDMEKDIDFSDIVADVPLDFMEDNFYDYEFSVEDSPIENMGKAIRIVGDNHSDDMFMGFYKKITGLEGNKEYIFKLGFDLGTNVSSNMMGIGGSPGSSVYVKAGIIPIEPKTIVKNDYYRIENIDKANQSKSGKDLKVITDLQKTSGDTSNDYEYKKVMQYFIAKTNDDGEAYIMIGTDSGFEGLTEVYYDNIKLSVREATEYNISTIQEFNCRN